MSLLHRLPAELIREVVEHLDLDDMITLQVQVQMAVPELSARVDSAFGALRSLAVNWSHKEADLVFTSIRGQTFDISTTNPFWNDVVSKSTKLRHLSVIKKDDAKDFSVLDEIAKAGPSFETMDIKMRPGKRTVCTKTTGQNYKRLTGFVAATARSVRRFRLETNEENYVEFEQKDKEQAFFRFRHCYDTFKSNVLITPLFNALLRGRNPLSIVTLALDWKSELALALQSAFQAAIPFDHRKHLQALRIDFGVQAATLSAYDIQQVLARYANDYLNDTRNLQRLVCDLSHSKLELQSLENLYKVISSELGSSAHRITLMTSASLSPHDVIPGQNKTNRVACS